MNFLARIWATLLIAVRRVLAQRWLALATTLGLVAAIALIMSIPLYSDAVYYRILQEELAQAGQSVKNDRQAFAFIFRYVGSIYGAKEWEDLRPVDDYLWGPAPDRLGLPKEQMVRLYKTDPFRLFPASDVASGAYASAREPLKWVSFATATDFDAHVTYLDGRAPAPSSADPTEPVEVVVSAAIADALGIQAGENYVTFRTLKTDNGDRTVQIPVLVSGIWQPNDLADPYWFAGPGIFAEHLVIPLPTFEGRISSLLNDEVSLAIWYWLLDGAGVNATTVSGLVARIDQVRQEAATLMPNTKLDVSPYEALQKYRAAANVLNILLYAFSLPIVLLLLAFISLVASLAVGQQRNEIAVLRSRGATAAQIAGIAALQATILGVLALAIAIPLSTWIAQAFGATRSFLNFTLDSNLRIQVSTTPLRLGLAALGITILAQVFPAMGAARHTIVSYKQEMARTVRRPWWQRAWLDVLLLIPAVYGVYLLRQQGGIVMPGAASGDLFDNPLLVLLPALVALALTLLTLRLLPLAMALLAALAARTSSVGLLLATRYLAREPGLYTTPLVLLMMTLSLSVFTASLARTLDYHLFDQSYYAVGADARLSEIGEMNAGTEGGSAGAFGAASGPASSTQLNVALGSAQESGQTGATASSEGVSTAPAEQWVFIPVSEHLRVKDIQAATRVGEFDSAVQVQGKWLASDLVGVDRLDFPKVAFWRQDFAPASLGALMNALAAEPEGVLVERRFLREQGLRVGDLIQVRVRTTDANDENPMKIVGDFDYFPTWYREQAEGRPLLVGNLDTIFERTGGERPYDVWVKAAPTIDYELMVDGLRDVEISVLDYRAAAVQIAAELRRPERQGLFGVLSVGFLAAALLTVLGFLLYALFSFRRRYIELGTLRAIGLSTRQLAIFLTCELAFLILLGLGAGTWIGTLISREFIPYFQIGKGPTANVPPFTVDIAWFAVTRLYMLFGVLFLVALLVLIVLLSRMKVFQAIKLGETV